MVRQGVIIASTQEIENHSTAMMGVETTEEAGATDNEHGNRTMQPQHSAIKCRASVTNKRPEQEAWDRGLGGHKTPTYLNKVELTQSNHA